MSKLTIQFDVVELDTVAEHFVRGYSKTGGDIKHYEYFVDTAKGKIAFKLYIEEPPPSEGSSE